MSKEKYYTRRDSATAVLRKLGIPSSQYRNYISIAPDGRFICNIASAENFVQKLIGKSKRPIKTTQRIRKERGQDVDGSPINPKKKKVTISGLCREKILDGLTNKEVFAAMTKEFGAGSTEGKEGYPSWYRCELKRKGLLKE